MKKMIALITVFFFILTNQAFAHTALETSIPKDGDIIQESMQEIVLTYATKIENGSTFELKNSTNEVVDVNITIENDVLKGVTAEPLPNDQYTLDWNIIGADGHPIKGSIAFQVDVSDQAAEEPAKEEMKQAKESNVDQAPATEENEVVEEQTADESTSSFPIVLVAILAAIAIGSLFFLRKRKG
ncbi:copper resistance CopC family protein [Priestia abyssalis]|uniref:copper resistance CopC family protein n=1 Tax=Priestia abyssalis TaxID=1221450 RepID=UPI00099577F4|nr:copper resistance protein CopC [Priestia abyssalis]